MIKLKERQFQVVPVPADFTRSRWNCCDFYEAKASSSSSHISEGTMLTSATSAPAALDNKIEQAMDLVKTHLTFAVREEVELLRSTITDLETKVRILENENRILRQYAPPEVLKNF